MSRWWNIYAAIRSQVQRSGYLQCMKIYQRRSLPHGSSVCGRSEALGVRLFMKIYSRARMQHTVSLHPTLESLSLFRSPPRNRQFREHLERPDGFLHLKDHTHESQRRCCRGEGWRLWCSSSTMLRPPRDFPGSFSGSIHKHWGPSDARSIGSPGGSRFGK